MVMHKPHIIATDSDSEFIEASVTTLADRINAAIADHGRCVLGLSGGATPKPIYAALGRRSDIDWSKVFVFLIDERCVPADAPESNQRMVRQSLLMSATIPHEHIVFPDTSLPIDACVADYSERLKRQWSDRLPDIIALGFGDDGHIASLFPPLSPDALSDERLVIHTTTDRFPGHDRITLTLNPIAAAGCHVLFLSGHTKKLAWEEMLGSDEDERRWPLKRILTQQDVTVITQW